jgi:hypothetical protein
MPNRLSRRGSAKRRSDHIAPESSPIRKLTPDQPWEVRQDPAFGSCPDGVSRPGPFSDGPARLDSGKTGADPIQLRPGVLERRHSQPALSTHFSTPYASGHLVFGHLLDIRSGAEGTRSGARPTAIREWRGGGRPAGGKRRRKQNDGNRRKSGADRPVSRRTAYRQSGRVRVRAAAQPAATPSPASSAPLPSQFPLFFPRPHLPINIGGKNSNTRTGNARSGGTLLRGLLRRLMAPSCFGGGSER